LLSALTVSFGTIAHTVFEHRYPTCFIPLSFRWYCGLRCATRQFQQSRVIRLHRTCVVLRRRDTGMKHPCCARVTRQAAPGGRGAYRSNPASSSKRMVRRQNSKRITWSSAAGTQCAFACPRGSQHVCRRQKCHAYALPSPHHRRFNRNTAGICFFCASRGPFARSGAGYGVFVSNNCRQLRGRTHGCRARNAVGKGRVGVQHGGGANGAKPARGFGYLFANARARQSGLAKSKRRGRVRFLFAISLFRQDLCRSLSQRHGLE